MPVINQFSRLHPLGIYGLISFVLSLWISFSAHATTVESTTALKPIQVQLNWHHQFEFAGFYAAIQQGYYQDVGLDVRLKHFVADKNVLNEVVKGNSQFGVGYATTIADYIKGAPIQLVMASFQHSPTVLISQAPISDLSELLGKKAMYNDTLQELALLNKASKQQQDSIIRVPSSTSLDAFIRKEVDFFGGFITNEPFQLQEMGVPYYIIDPKLYGVNSAENLVFTTSQYALENPATVAAFREATIKGWQFAMDNPDTVIDYMLAHYTVPKSRKALEYEAKALRPYVSVGTRPIGVIEPERLKETALELKEIGLISQANFEVFNPSKFLGLTQGKVNLTSEELAYLAKNPVIQLANDIDWAPIEFIDNEGNFRGLAADYFKIFEQMLGVKFIPETEKSWSEVKALAKSGERMIFSGTVSSPERRNYMHFTDPYLSFPMVLVAGNNVSYVSDYRQLEGQTVAVVKDYWSHEYFARKYPKVNLLVTNSVNEALTAVMTGKALVYSENLAVVNFAMRKKGMDGLSIVGEAHERAEISIGVHHQQPLLFSIMQKTLASVSEEDKRSIYDRWIHIELVKRLDNKQIRELTVYSTIIVILLLTILLSYRYQRNRFKHYTEQINELNYASKVDLATQKVVWVSRSYADLRGCKVTDLLGKDYIELAKESFSEASIQAIREQLLSGEAWSGEVEGKRCDGSPYWVHLTLTPQTNWLGDVTHFWATRVDISDKKRIEQLSNTDELTQLYNRHYFNQILPKLLVRNYQTGNHLCLASIDIDFFKLVNDTYGHLVGDQVLKQVSALLKKCCPQGDALAFRMGGEEFLLVMFVENPDDFYQQLEALRIEVFNAKIENRDTPLGWVSISIGACCWQMEASIGNWELLYRDVDDLLYQAKQSGRNKLVTPQG